MCRFVVYRGKPVPLAQVISAPAHSLIAQSYRPKEMTVGTVNVDGFGVGWYNRALEPTPCIYTNIVPIWNDRNLPGLSRHIVSDCIVATVRGATPGFGLDQSNCQPFAHGRLTFMHNGFLEKAGEGLLRTIRAALRDEYYGLIQGSTDSEHIFALLLNFLHGQAQTPQAYATAMRRTVAQLRAWTRGQAVRMALNLVLSDGVHVVALRFANIAPAPSLYYLCNGADFSEAVVIASERLSAEPGWQTVPEGHIVTCGNAADITLLALDDREAA